MNEPLLTSSALSKYGIQKTSTKEKATVWIMLQHNGRVSQTVHRGIPEVIVSNFHISQLCWNAPAWLVCCSINFTDCLPWNSQWSHFYSN